jgi:uncharacterized membrane protein
MLRAGSWWALALFVAALAAFWPQYLSKLPQAQLAAHAHAVLMTAWIAMLIVQPQLVARERRELHRQIGRWSYALVPATVLAGLYLWHVRLFAVPAEGFDAAIPSLYLGLGATANFALYWALAIRHRRVAPVHGRYMLATLLPMVDPVTARLLGFYGPHFEADWVYALPAWLLAAVVVGGLAWRDARGAGPARWTFLRVLGIYALFQAPILLLAPSPWWRAAMLAYRGAFTG